MLELRSATFGYGNNVLCSDVSVQIGPDHVAIMGPSGSGKSTLLKVLAGQHQLSEGSAMLDGEVIVSDRRGRLRDPRVATIYQDYRLAEFLTISENVALGGECRGKKMTEDACNELLDLVGLQEIPRTRLPGQLSGGEQQRVAIARALASDCRVLLADEPTGALDSTNTLHIANTIRTVCESRGIQLVVATHDDRVAALMATVMFVEDGSLR